jgi:hypothetical protein
MLERGLFLSLALAATLLQVWVSTSLDSQAGHAELQHPQVPTAPVAWMYGGLRRRSAADLQWVRAANYAGNNTFEQEGRPALGTLVRLVIALDPSQEAFYRVGGLLLASERNAAPEAVQLLDECAQRFPDLVACPFFSGILRLTQMRDPKGAAASWRVALERPGAPAYLRGLLDRLEVKGGRCVAAVFALRQLIEATPARARGALLAREQPLRLECALQQLEAAVGTYRERHGAPPPSLTALVEDGELPALPADPYGVGYVLQPDGTVRSKTGLPRLELGAEVVP